MPGEGTKLLWGEMTDQKKVALGNGRMAVVGQGKNGLEMLLKTGRVGSLRISVQACIAKRREGGKRKKGRNIPFHAEEVKETRNKKKEVKREGDDRDESERESSRLLPLLLVNKETVAGP